LRRGAWHRFQLEAMVAFTQIGDVPMGVLAGSEVASGRNRRTSAMKRIVSVALVTALLGVVAVAMAPSTEAHEGLDIGASYVYRIDDAGDVRVEATFTLRNDKANTRRGNTITSYFFPGFSVFLPDDADQVTVTDGTQDLNFEVEEVEAEDGSGTFSVVEADFRRNLNYRVTTTMVVSYRLAGSEPRSESINRINPAYALFAIWGIADPGKLDIRVEIPPRYTVDTAGVYIARETSSGGTVLEAFDVESPDDFFVTVVARDNDALDLTSVTTSGTSIDVHAWPGDLQWQQFVEDRIRDGVPTLEALIGMDWPEDEGFDVVQSSEPGFAGYAGWYDGEAGEIVIDEQLDEQTILHELAHAWFNSDLFDARWQGEALAEEFARLAAIELGNDAVTPTPPDDDLRLRGGLNGWTIRSATDADEEWGYTASAWVMKELSDDVGAEGLRLIIDAAQNNTAAYQDASGQISFDEIDDWRRMLDLAQHLADSDDVESLFRTYVVSDSDAELLDERSDALDVYEDLRASGADWFVPIGVISALNEWDFETSNDVSAAAGVALDEREAFAERVAELGLGIDNGPLLDEAKSAYEAAVNDFTDVSRSIARRQNAVASVESTTAALQAPRSFLTRVGLYDQDPLADLDVVISHLKADEPELAVEAAAELVATLDEAAKRGQTLVTYAALAAFGGLVVLTMIVVWARRRRRHRRRRRARMAMAIDPGTSVFDLDTGGPIRPETLLGPPYR